MLKKITVLIFLLTYSKVGLSQRHGCQLEDTIFFSYTLDHTKAVELCRNGENIKLTYGKVGNAELILEKDISNASIFYYGPSNGIRIIDGTNIYEVMGKQFSDSVLKFKIEDGMLYQVLDSRDENFINQIN